MLCWGTAQEEEGQIASSTDSASGMSLTPTLHSCHLTSSTAGEIQELTSCFLFGATLLLDHSPDFRLAYAIHFGHVGFHLVTITLLGRWLQQQTTK
jgi:hypothetical protein